MVRSRTLKPKPVSPIVPIAKALKEMGFDPIPMRSKTKPYTGWRTQPNTPADIDKWQGKTLAVRMDGAGELFAIDLDIQREDILEAIIAKYRERWPEFMDKCVIRHSDRVKVMLIGRLTTTKRWLYSGRYGATEEHPGGNRVEVFTCNDPRYIAVWGLHSTGRYYGYDGPELHTVPIKLLPEFHDEDLNELLTIANEVMEAAGLTLVEKPGGDTGDIAYDLTPDMQAETEDGRQVTLLEVEEEAGEKFIYLHGRLFDPGSDSFRIKAKVTRSNGLTLWDFGTGTVHYWKHHGPQPEVLAPLLKALAERAAAGPSMFDHDEVTPRLKAAGVGDVMPPFPPDGAHYDDRLLWLLQTHGYCALNDTVVELYQPSSECQLKPAAFDRRYKAWHQIIRGPRGGTTIQLTTESWELAEHRTHLRGIRMRPDRTFPVYVEDGDKFKNTYQRPVHEGDGDIGPWLRFMAHLLPHEVEREWFCNWLAHKHRHPGVPGVAVIMVACDRNGPVYGTGRGFLRDICARLLGQKYVVPIDFDVLTGKSAQGVYTDWAAYALLVTVSESKDTAESGRWSERRAVYERLKELVEPRAVERTFQVKGSPAFRALSFASYLIASNNRDSVQVPQDDRRFAALANGLRMAPAMAIELSAWMEVPGNIAALARWLEARPLEKFDAYEPLVTKTKITMQQLARSEQDDWFAAVRREISSDQLFTATEVMTILIQEAGSEASRGEDFRRWVTRRIRAEACSFDADWRMPLNEGRGRILHWRDYDGPEITTVEQAQERVRSSGETRKQNSVAAKRKGFTVHAGGLDATSPGQKDVAASSTHEDKT